MQIERFKKGAVVFHQDSIADKFYIILEGQIAVLVNNDANKISMDQENQETIEKNHEKKHDLPVNIDVIMQKQVDKIFGVGFKLESIKSFFDNETFKFELVNKMQ